jgi:hypothetical protein
MPGSELRTYVIGLVVLVLLGAGSGFGWHYFVDRAGGRAVAATAVPPAKPEVANSPMSNSPAQREGPGPDIPRPTGTRDAQQSARSTAFDFSKDEKLTLAALLTRSIADDRYPSSPRVRTLQSILAKLDPKPPAELALKASSPTGVNRASTRRRE